LILKQLSSKLIGTHTWSNYPCHMQLMQ
jgi:hypothetical protein